ncbi:hypothetical protein ACQ3I4_15965 [Zafaria sp. Z1313]|uniref:hypothetical protein n=1 Tax=unclassified Zafaria TaxID=2828765 RepID=UPI002E78A0D4|nr:hypothetical protein [Zafaria sp. J156]MEE1622794.1 hypothetical protein [Zafaria sp. J156]
MNAADGGIPGLELHVPGDRAELHAAREAVGRGAAGLTGHAAVAAAGDVLAALRLPHWALCCGGYVYCAGSPFPAPPDTADPCYGDPFYGRPWRAGITAPRTASSSPGEAELLADVPLAGTPGFTAAIATEAGDRADAFAQVSVLAEDLGTARSLALAVLRAGQGALRRGGLASGTAGGTAAGGRLAEVLAVPWASPGRPGTPLATHGWPRHPAPTAHGWPLLGLEAVRPGSGPQPASSAWRNATVSRPPREPVPDSSARAGT